MPIMMNNGKFLILDDDYKLDFRGSIRNAIMNGLLDYTCDFGFTADNTSKMVDTMTTMVLETIKFYKEQEKLQKETK